jgi:hypothetical protein
LALFTENPRMSLLGNSHSYTRIPIRYRGVCKRACSAGFLEEFFSETPRAIGNVKAPDLFTEGFYRYSVFSTSLDVSNHHLNLLLARRFIFCLRDRQQPLRVLAVRALSYDLLRTKFASSNDLFGCAICSTRYSNRINKGEAE